MVDPERLKRDLELLPNDKTAKETLFYAQIRRGDISFHDGLTFVFPEAPSQESLDSLMAAVEAIERLAVCWEQIYGTPAFVKKQTSWSSDRKVFKFNGLSSEFARVVSIIGVQVSRIAFESELLRQQREMDRGEERRLDQQQAQRPPIARTIFQAVRRLFRRGYRGHVTG